MARAFGPALCLLQPAASRAPDGALTVAASCTRPEPTTPLPTSPKEQIKRRAALGGLINDHERAA